MYYEGIVAYSFTNTYRNNIIFLLRLFGSTLCMMMIILMMVLCFRQYIMTDADAHDHVGWVMMVHHKNNRQENDKTTSHRERERERSRWYI